MQGRGWLRGFRVAAKAPGFTVASHIAEIGDTGFDAVVPANYWKDAVAAILMHMHEAGPLDALREGLRRLGDSLAEHWPREGDDVNEHPDEILR